MFIFGITNITAELLFPFSLLDVRELRVNERRKPETLRCTCGPSPVGGSKASAQTAVGQTGNSKKTSTFCGICAYKMLAYIFQYIR